MKRKRFSEALIAFALEDARPGGACGEQCTCPLVMRQSRAPAALSVKSCPFRMYRFNIVSDACPVWALIFSAETPACAALVANPALKLWPE